MPINVYGGDVNILNFVEPDAQVKNEFNGTVNFGSELKNKVQESKAIYTSRDEQLVAVAHKFMPSTEKNTRLWFCFCKAMMWHDDVVDGDFAGAVTRLQAAFGGTLPFTIDSKDISRLNVLSFSKTLDKWQLQNSPFRRGNDYLQYEGMAKMAYKLLDPSLIGTPATEDKKEE